MTTHAYDFRDRTASSKKPLYGHVSPETAYVIDDYPSGFKARCRRRVWLEYKAKQGWRFVSQTSAKWYPGEEPAKDQPLRWNKPDASTYAQVAGCLYLDPQDHVQWTGLGLGSSAPTVLEFMHDFPQADFGAIKVYVTMQIRQLVNSLMGRSVWTINGAPQPPSDHELGEKRKGLEQWAEVARKAGLAVPQEVKDLVDGTVKPQQFDNDAYEQQQKVRQEQIEAAKAKAAEAPGALNFAEFEERVRSKVKLDGRPLVFTHGGGIRAWVVYHNIKGAAPSGSFGGKRQRYVITGFGRDPSQAVAKIKVEMEENTVRAKPADPSDYRAGYKETALRGKTGTPEKIADYLAAHINELVKEIPVQE